MKFAAKTVIMTVIILSSAGCGDDSHLGKWADMFQKGKIPSAKSTHTQAEIIWIQAFLIPAGLPLTHDQQERIASKARPPYHRTMFGELTGIQKLLFAEYIRQEVEGGGCPPLTERQFERLCAFGPNSDVNHYGDILTSGQLNMLKPSQTSKAPISSEIPRFMSRMAEYTQDEIIVMQHINRLQQVLVPASDSLTMTQKQALIKSWQPDGYDMRPLYNAMTKSQKRLIVEDIEKQLTPDGHPFDGQQAERIMELGSESDDRYIWDILTPEQAAKWSRVQVARRNERSDQPYQMALWMSYVDRTGWTPPIAVK